MLNLNDTQQPYSEKKKNIYTMDEDVYFFLFLLLHNIDIF